MPTDLTDAEARALGERWLKAAGPNLEGWRSGMLDNHGRRVIRADAFTVEWTRYDADLHPWPDPRDPATRGAMLEVVRERLADPSAHLVPPSPRDPGDVWTFWGQGRDGMGRCYAFARTEAEALVAALEAAPR
jgi:hypothetical protein